MALTPATYRPLIRPFPSTVAAHGTLTLTLFGDDVVLENPAPFEARQSVPLTLIFRDAGTVTIQVAITAPGTS